MDNATPKIIGLLKPIEDPGTGAMTHFHVIKQYSVTLVDPAKPTSSATFACYASPQAALAGKNPMAHTTVSVPGAPPVGDEAVSFLYNAVAGFKDERNPLAGADRISDVVTEGA